jgi:hypothetical protein
VDIRTKRYVCVCNVLVPHDLVDPTEEQRKRPLARHIEDFQAYLRNKGVGPKQVGETMRMVKRMVTGRKWRLIAHISASGALDFLGGLRRDRSGWMIIHPRQPSRRVTASGDGRTHRSCTRRLPGDSRSGLPARGT